MKDKAVKINGGKICKECAGFQWTAMPGHPNEMSNYCMNKKSDRYTEFTGPRAYCSEFQRKAGESS